MLQTTVISPLGFVWKTVTDQEVQKVNPQIDETCRMKISVPCPGHRCQGVTFVQVPELLLCEVVPGRRHGHIGGVVAALLDQGLLAPPPLQGPGDTVNTGDRM